jgi:hypothetical protein
MQDFSRKAHFEQEWAFFLFDGSSYKKTLWEK